MIKKSVNRLFALNLNKEDKQEFRNEIANSNLSRGKIIAIALIIIELLVIIVSIINCPKEIITKTKGYYYIMYILFIAVMSIALFFIGRFTKRNESNTKKMFALTYSVAAFVLLWCMLITLMDQSSCGNLVTYFAALVGISVLICMQPKALIIIYFSVQIAFIVLLPFFITEGDSPFDEYINTSITMLISCFIGLAMYSNKAENFCQRKTIQQKNKLLKKLNRQLTESNRTLDFLSKTDGLTGIFNRRMFDEISRNYWDECIAHKHSLTAIMMDIDYFKEYNDNFGHQAGDDCLIKLVDTISYTLKQYSDKDYILARYGGEEFVLVICNITQDSAYKLAESIRRNVEKLGIERKFNEVSNHITLSLGVFFGYPISDTSAYISDYVGNADKALYEAKKAGRNLTKVFS